MNGRPLRSALASGATVAAALLVTLLVLEIGLRVYSALTPNVDVEFTRYARMMKGSAGSGVGFLHEPGARGTFFGVEVAIDSRGFRDREVEAEKAADEVRVGVLGDSITFGWGVAYGDRFTELLEDAWSAGGPLRYELVNTGHGNYNTVQQLAMLQEHLAGEPLDGLIQAWYINDAEPTPVHRDAPWYSRSRLAVFLWGKADLLSRRAGARQSFVEYYQDLYREDAAGYVAFGEALRGTGEEARRRGLPWFFVILPEFHGFDPEGPFEGVYERVAALAEGAGATVVSAVPAFRDVDPATIRVAVNDVHPNARGHAIIARAIREALDPAAFEGEPK